MRITYVCHACLLIETGDCRIATDPWFVGSSYCDQWFLFPKPVETESLRNVDCILISHGHEDHLHPGSMEKLNKAAKVFYPYNWYGSIKGFMSWMGYENVQEAITFRKYQLSPRTAVTYIANNLDSIIVLESDGKVLVDVNDALHCHHPNVIRLFCAEIRKRWPKIDIVFCGFGGASYFPNNFHMDGKNDREVGELREQFFVHNFCRIVEGLQPKMAVPFAADLVVLDQDKRWINEVRFPREKIGDYYRRHFARKGDNPTIFAMYPGDVIENGKLQPHSPYRSELKNDRLDHLVESQYLEEVAMKRSVSNISEPSAQQLATELAKNIENRLSLLSPRQIAALRFCVKATDVTTSPYYNISLIDGKVQIDRSEVPSSDNLLEIHVSSVVLRHSMASVWGGDAITIGFASEIYLRDARALEFGLDTACVRLLTRHPVATKHMMKHPARASRWLWQNPLTRQWAIKRLRNRGNANAVFDPNVWFTRTKCEVCQVCDFPLLDNDFASTLHGA